MTTYVNDPSKLSLSNDTTATTLNTGGVAGVTLDPVTSASGTITYQDGKWRCDHGNGVARFDLNIAATSMLSVEVLYTGAAIPGAESRILDIRYDSGYALYINQYTDGRLRIQDFLNVNIFETTSVIPSPFRLHVGVEKGTGTTDGKIRFDVYTADSGLSTTPLETFSSDTENMGTFDLTEVRVGRASTTAGSAVIDLVNLQVSDEQITSLGPLEVAPAGSYYVNDPSLLILPNGTAATAGNTGGEAGVAMTPVQSGGSSILYQDGAWRHVHNTGVARFDVSVTASSQIAVEVLYFEPEGSSPFSERIIEVWNGTEFILRVNRIADGRIGIYDSVGWLIHTSVNPPPSRYRIHIGLEKGTTTTDGKVRFSLFTADSGLSIIPEETWESDIENIGTGDFDLVRVGRINTATGTQPLDLINLQISTAKITTIGPLLGSSAPLAILATPNSAVIDARGTMPGSSGSLEFSISPFTGVAVPTPGLFLVPLSEQATLYTVTVTESPSGLTDTAEVTIDPQTITGNIAMFVFNGTDWV